MKFRYVALLILVVAIAPGMVADLCHAIAAGALDVANTAVNKED